MLEVHDLVACCLEELLGLLFLVFELGLFRLKFRLCFVLSLFADFTFAIEKLVVVVAGVDLIFFIAAAAQIVLRVLVS